VCAAVLSLLDETTANAEVVFVFDGSPPPVPAWLDRPGVTIVKTGTRSGPAIARNLAAESARGEVLFFVDADVELAADAIDRVHAAFAADPDLVGLFGAYDDEPAAVSLTSTFRNLLHHHTHVSNPGTAGTFWSGCGAMRTTAFLDVGGFDEKFAYPSVEDIELGMRVAANGGKILLAPDVRCKHLKHWTLASMVITDIVHRATPWTRLIMNSRELPASLNLDWRGRLSGICSVLLAACLAVAVFAPVALWAALACGLVVVALNSSFYGLCARKRGVGFAVASFALHWLYFRLLLADVWRGHAPRTLAALPTIGRPRRWRGPADGGRDAGGEGFPTAAIQSVNREPRLVEMLHENPLEFGDRTWMVVHLRVLGRHEHLAHHAR
jgi:glycosyltransferase involved in cell wall biosynthesis